MNNYFNINSKNIILTGVSGKLGTEYAISLLDQGARVIGIDLSENENKALKNSKNFIFFKSDITNKNCLKDIANKLDEMSIIPDALINNAAIDNPPVFETSEKVLFEFESFDEKYWDKVMDVNLKGVFLSCQVFGSLMKKIGGSIINISSIYGLVSPDQSLYSYKQIDNKQSFYKPVAYSVSKSGIYNLSRYLATYWADSNIRVNTLTLSGIYDDQDQEFISRYCERIPIGRMATHSDFIGPLIFLISDSSSYITGSNIIVDGGWTAI